LIASMFLAMQATQPANAASTTVTFEANDGSYVVVDAGDGGSVATPTVALTGGGTKALKIDHYGQYTGVTFQDLSGYEMLTAADMTVTAKIYSDAIGTPFLLKIEGATSLEKAYVATAIGWQDATWDFSTGLPNYWNGSASVPQVVNHATNYKKATLFPNFGSWGGGPYYLDNVTFNKTVTCDISSPAVLASMESSDTSGITPVGFGGTTGEITTAPEGGSYGNQKALKIVKGWETWAGITVLENFCFNYGVGGSATANVYAPAAGLPMMLKLEGPNTGWDGDDVERTATTWRAGWQQLKWDLTGVTGNHSKVALFPNFNVADNGRVFFLDDLAFNGATSPMWGNNLMNIPQSPSSLENPGKYVHVRLQKTFIGSSYDASWWDGIREYRDADTKAYVKYLSARSTFSLTYKVTDANGAPMANTPVELIVNANYSCSKATFTYGATVIGRDDCGGKGETRLPKKNTDGNGDVTFVLTNTNVKGEAMPSSLSSPPTVGVANEIGSNIQPYVADKQGFDMLLVHFVEPTGSVTLSGAATAAMTVDTKTPVTFNLKDAKGKAMAGVDVKFVADGVGTVGRTATTDSDGNVSTWVNNYTDAPGVQIVSATYVGSNGFAATTSTVIQWSSTKPFATVTGGKGVVTVSIANGAGKTARISVAGSATISRKLSSNSAVVKVKASAGTKVVTVVIDGVATKVSVQVTK
jgi:hypothetical protein